MPHATLASCLLLSLFSLFQVNLHEVDVFALHLQADYYQISSLKTLCENFVVSRINSENMSYALQMARKHRMFGINEKCISLMARNAREVCCFLLCSSLLFTGVLYTSFILRLFCCLYPCVSVRWYLCSHIYSLSRPLR